MRSPIFNHQPAEKTLQWGYLEIWAHPNSESQSTYPTQQGFTQHWELALGKPWGLGHSNASVQFKQSSGEVYEDRSKPWQQPARLCVLQLSRQALLLTPALGDPEVPHHWPSLQMGQLAPEHSCTCCGNTQHAPTCRAGEAVTYSWLITRGNINKELCGGGI